MQNEWRLKTSDSKIHDATQIRDTVAPSTNSAS